MYEFSPFITSGKSTLENCSKIYFTFSFLLNEKVNSIYGNSTEEADQIARSKKKMKRSTNAEEVEVEGIENEVMEESHAEESPRGVS